MISRILSAKSLSPILKNFVTPLKSSSRGAAGRWRELNNLPRRYASPGPIADTCEWSYVDGRGPAPLNKKQRSRHLRDAYFTEEIIKFTKMTKEAKRLLPEEPRFRLQEE
ncbi:hypothetical protein HDE_05515 [Halotydeus destructor]|nr:hypothetical protein HDE_05515 [Halotydeus destructor]